MKGFDVFPRQQLGRHAGPAQLRVGKDGSLVLTVVAMELLRECGFTKHVQLLHNRDTGDIALRPTGDDDPNGYSIRKNGDRGGAVSARAFVRHVGLEVGSIFVCETDDGMLLAHKYVAAQLEEAE